MEKKIISKHRYSKITSDRKKNKDKIVKAKVKSKIKIKSIKNPKIIKAKKLDIEYKEPRKEIDVEEIKNASSVFLKIVLSCIALILLGLSSKYIFNFTNNIANQVFSNKSNDISLVTNYDFKIGVFKLGNNDVMKNHNVILNELIKESNPGLVKISSDYEVNNVLAESISRKSDTEYEVKLKDTIEVKVADIISTVDSIKNFKEESAFYSKVSNIDSIKEISNNLFTITIKQKDPYFIYNLDFPIFSISPALEYKKFNFTSWENNSFKFARNDIYSKNIVNSISVSNYADNDSLVSDFVNNKLDLFVTSSYNAMQLIGKHEYSLKKYRNGETIFLFGNKDSQLFKNKEIRQAISYSINRDEILRNIDISYAEQIDLPYIYSSNSFRYDTYGASNIMIQNGWRKIEGVYGKTVEGKLIKAEITLIVNEQDNLKINIANNIKSMVESVGIRVNVVKLSPNKIDERIKSGNYDYILSTVNVNENPNVSYLEKYLNINEFTKEAFENVNNSDLGNLKANIDNLQKVLASQVACVGIIAKDTNVVYQKNISGLDTNISYLNIFKNLEKLGKIK